MTKPQLFMRHPDLTQLPGPPTLSRYALRAADLANEHERAQLADLLSAGFDTTWTPEEVARTFSESEGVQATYVATVQNEIVGTASARVLPETYPDSGYLHYVAVRPTERGRHLGAAVTMTVLAHFLSQQLTVAVLETDDFRLPAIRTYLRLGFVPEYRQPEDELRWSLVLRSVLSSRPASPPPAAHVQPSYAP